MKKFFAITTAMVMALSTTAFAAEAGNTTIDDTTTDYKYEIKVEGKYESEYAGDTVISVDVKWDAMNFVYADTSEGDWDPATHSYTGKSTTPGWVDSAKNITLTNHSNTAVKAAFEFTKDADRTENITGTFGADTKELATAVGTTYANAPSVTNTFKISGDAITSTSDITLGKITITLSKKDAE